MIRVTTINEMVMMDNQPRMRDQTQVTREPPKHSATATTNKVYTTLYNLITATATAMETDMVVQYNPTFNLYNDKFKLHNDIFKFYNDPFKFYNDKFMLYNDTFKLRNDTFKVCTRNV